MRDASQGLAIREVDVTVRELGAEVRDLRTQVQEHSTASRVASVIGGRLE